MSRARQGGNTILEAVLLLPVLCMLLFGMVDLARLSWTYFTLQKILYGVGRYAATQTAVNFCDDADPILADAKNLALRGIGNAAGELQLAALTADLIQVRLERVQPDSGALGDCECTAAGCDNGQGGRGPDFVVVSVNGGYSVRTNIPFVPSETFLLRPVVRVPYGAL
ncbi:MAG TPA: TadE/TadG family type IV pilus assembly protein [Bryobacteraceae bacterium]|nr:TadE/TadG family type IV pilus assembly protein [Bryobacteraceae bacterium]